MIFDSVKSAEPTVIDFRSPDISPPPRGLELPHAGSITVISANTATRTARLHRRVLDIRLDIPKPSRPLAPHGHYRDARRNAALCVSVSTHGGFIRSGKGQRWTHDQRFG